MLLWFAPAFADGKDQPGEPPGPPTLFVLAGDALRG
jgi:hypothetical protein